MLGWAQAAELSASVVGGLRLRLAGSRGQLSGARATVAFSHFVPTATDAPLDEAAAAAAPEVNGREMEMKRQTAAYSSGRKLSEETRYCLERRQLEQQVCLLGYSDLKYGRCARRH